MVETGGHFGASAALDGLRTCVILRSANVTTVLSQLVTIDFSGERCARNVQALSGMTRAELETFLGTTARAAAGILFVRAPRAKPEKVSRTPRHKLRRDRWR